MKIIVAINMLVGDGYMNFNHRYLVSYISWVFFKSENFITDEWHAFMTFLNHHDKRFHSLFVYLNMYLKDGQIKITFNSFKGPTDTHFADTSKIPTIVNNLIQYFFYTDLAMKY